MKIQLVKRKKTFALVAMADIAFLLLIFLILTMSADQNGEITLPRFKYSQSTSFPDTIIIEVKGDDFLFIQGRDTSYGKLPAELGRLKSAEPQTVRLFAEGAIDYSLVDQLLTILKEEEFHKVILVTEDE